MSPVIKPKGEKFTLPSKYLLFILTILCTGLMILTFTTSALSTPLSYAAGFLVVPFEKGIAKVGSYLNERTEMLQEIQNLIEENEALKQQVVDLTNENISLQQDRFELTNLRQLYQLDAAYADYLVITGNLETYAEGMIEFGKLIDEKNQVVEGDKLVTSNISDHYLPGILIGYISSLDTDSNNLTKSGYVTPAVDFSHLEEVLVILEQKQTIEE